MSACDLYPDQQTYFSEVFRSALRNLARGYITFKGALETIIEAAAADVPPTS